MIKRKTAVLVLLFLFSLTWARFSHGQESAVLQKIETSQIGKVLEVKIYLSKYFYHRQFKLYNPNRIGIDIFKIRSIQAPQRINVNASGIKAIRLYLRSPEIARLMFDLTDEIPPYTTERFEGGLRILFWKEEAELPPPPPPPPPPKVEEEEPETVCNLMVSPERLNPNEIISIDMSGSQNATTMVVDIFDASGTKIASQELSPGSPQWEFSLDLPGEYTFQGKAFDAQGKQSENPCEAKITINFPPLSRLECKKCAGRTGQVIALDASNSRDPDGKIVKVEFQVTDEEGLLVDSYADQEAPFIWEKAFDKKGIYSIMAIATDDLGAASEPSRVEVFIGEKKLFFMVDAGALAARGEGTYVGYGAGRIGILFEFAKNLGLILAGGGAYSFVDSDPWWNYYRIDLILNMNTGPIFIGVGGAYSSRYKATMEKNYWELITNVGFDLFNGSRMTGSIFIEASGPVVDLDIQENHKFGLGFRLTF